MTAAIISGTEIAARIKDELKKEILELGTKYKLTPGLAVILVGDNPASRAYVGGKEKDCRELGIYSERHNLPETVTEKDLLSLIESLNHNPEIHGILVQLPLPKHIDENKVINAINPQKDADGFHPVNLGKLMIGEPDFLPCTPYGIQEMLVRSNIPIEGAEVVIVGRSNIVGKPIANILLQNKKDANATVTVCHTRTRDLASHTRRADILIVAAGKAKAITADMVKDGVVVIDVGVNRIGKNAAGRDILVGDVDFEAVKEKAKAITPVPGGVGLMTRAMLMVNTVKAAKIAAGIK